MKTTIETIIKQTRSALLEEAAWQERMGHIGRAKSVRDMTESSPAAMLHALSGMVDDFAAGDDLSCLDEREAPVEYFRPIDATGEPLEVGDLVRVEGELWVVAKIQRRAGQWQIIFDAEKWTWSLPEHWTWSLPEHCTKTTILTRKEYLPLARRTMDPDLTKKERLAMLAMGVIGEMNEFIWCRKTDQIVAEAGDVLWYAEQLIDEIGELQGDGYSVYDWENVALWEIVKKAVFHDVGVDKLRQIAASAIVHVQEHFDEMGVDMGIARAANIKKLMRRYPGGFVPGGGAR